MGAIAAIVEGFEEVELAVLYGSLARGRPRPDSDLDLAVRWCGAADGLRRLEAQVGRAARRTVDLVHLDEAPPLLRFEIARGRLLVERKAGAWPMFKAHAMIDWWDFAPMARRSWRTYARRLGDDRGQR